MEPMIHFISGLPRSGSTLLCNILAQNPRFHATATSGILDVMFGVRNQWDKLQEFKAAIDKDGTAKAMGRVLRAILFAYHDETGKPVVFDKSRSWLAHLEMAEAVLGRKAKVLVPVRDIRDVLASFEKIWRKTSANKQIAQEQQFYVEFQTVQGRCHVWFRPDQPVGLAYNRIKDALHRGFRNRMHFVPFERLTQAPEQTLRGIYEFLEEAPYPHNFDHVEQVTFEDDYVHGFPGMHTIRPKVEPATPQWPEVLGKAAAPYTGMELW